MCWCKIIHILPQVLVSWLGVHVGQAVPAKAVNQAPALELLQDERSELRVSGKQWGRVDGAAAHHAGASTSRAVCHGCAPGPRGRPNTASSQGQRAWVVWRWRRGWRRRRRQLPRWQVLRQQRWWERRRKPCATAFDKAYFFSSFLIIASFKKIMMSLYNNTVFLRFCP